MTRAITLFVLALATPVLAVAGAPSVESPRAVTGPIGSWSAPGGTRLQVLSAPAGAEAGRFDWSTPSRRAVGSWRASERVLSLRTADGDLAYAYQVDGDRLTLTSPSGGRIELRRVVDRDRRRGG